MIYKYTENPSYKLEGSYETIEEAVNSLEKIPSNAKYLIRKKIANGDLSFCGGYVWTDQPLDSVSAYKEEEKPQPQTQSQPADVFPREQVRDFMLASAQIFSKMMDYDSSWVDFAANCNELLNEYKTSLSAILLTWASKGDVEKRLAAIRFHSDRKVTSVPAFIKIKVRPISDYQDLENTIILLAKAIELIDPQVN